MGKIRRKVAGAKSHPLKHFQKPSLTLPSNDAFGHYKLLGNAVLEANY
jgi:hypothetical protein